MPFVLVIAGLLMIVTGARGTYQQFGSQIATDGVAFIKWGTAIAIIGGAGYIQDLRQLSHAFMALVILSMFLANNGVFQKFTAAINAGPTAPKAATS